MKGRHEATDHLSGQSSMRDAQPSSWPSATSFWLQSTLYRAFSALSRPPSALPWSLLWIADYRRQVVEVSQVALDLGSACVPNLAQQPASRPVLEATQPESHLQPTAQAAARRVLEATQTESHLPPTAQAAAAVRPVLEATQPENHLPPGAPAEVVHRQETEAAPIRWQGFWHQVAGSAPALGQVHRLLPAAVPRTQRPRLRQHTTHSIPK